MTQITLKRSIITPRYKTIPAGTILQFDKDGATKIEDETIFIYRIHALCYDLTESDQAKYYPDYFVNPRDEMLKDSGDEIFDDEFGILSVSDVAFGNDCIELAREFNSYLKWDWLMINHDSIAVTADDGRDLHFILSQSQNILFRLQSYAFSLLEEEISEKNIGDCIELKVDDTEKRAKVFAFGRGGEWIEQQVSERPVGRNGEPMKLNLASDTNTLHILCEIEGGQLMILPYGKDYGVEVFGYGIFKHQRYDIKSREAIYPRNFTRFAISYIESLELFAKISTTDINNCNIAVAELEDGSNEYLQAFNQTCLDFSPILTYIPTTEQCVCLENYIEYIKWVNEARIEKISFVPVKEAYYKSMRVNPVIRMRPDSIVNRSLGFSTGHTIVCIGEYAYGLLSCNDGFDMGEPGFEMEIDNRTKISDIDFSEMEFAQFKCNTICFDEEKFDSSILNDFDTFKPSFISEADFLKIKSYKEQF